MTLVPRGNDKNQRRKESRLEETEKHTANGQLSPSSDKTLPKLNCTPTEYSDGKPQPYAEEPQEYVAGQLEQDIWHEVDARHGAVSIRDFKVQIYSHTCRSSNAEISAIYESHSIQCTH